ncbi:hypothetical protein KR222_009684 [Zaprionus bogoriensis]|nr:hypothetical protein KR222_009684 [Zaprionus bogoriensis]
MMSIKVLLLLGVTLTVVLADEEVLGGVKPLTGQELKDAESTLNDSLTKLASGDGPNYKLGKVISATHQVVSGSLFVYEVELIEGSKTKLCNVKIWSQPWLENGIEVTFNCPDGKIVKKHSA